MADNVTSTIVGESIFINGNLQGDEDLTVLGRVEGSINLTKTLNVEESGIVKANISVRNAIVSGVVVGNITASDSVEITEVGRMVGDIRAPRVIIVDGARYRGAVDMGDLEAPRASGPLPVRAADRALARPATSPSSPAVRPALPSAPSAVAARRPGTPPPSPTATAGTAPMAPRPMSSPAAPTPSAPAPARPPPMAPAAAAPAPTPAGAPILADRKFKKKVVVKKRGE